MIRIRINVGTLLRIRIKMETLIRIRIKMFINYISKTLRCGSFKIIFAYLRNTFWSLLPAGIYTVEVLAEGYKPLYKSVTVISGKVINLLFSIF
jgi:hypothetical protein